MGEVAGAGDHVPVVVCKGKRSKRLRVHAAPPSPAMVTPVASAEVDDESSSSAAGDRWLSPGGDQEEEAASGCVTEEDEDMALCLMLLAGGGTGRAGPSSSSPVVVAADTTVKEGKFRSRRAAGADGEFVYECRTCGKCFPSFQALGGHRTSHKKPRLLLPPTTPLSSPPTDEKKRPSTASPAPHATADPTVLVIPVPATPPKHEVATVTAVTSGGSRQQQQRSRLHECTICGAEFGSGQALGGHMRRHRPLVPALSTDDVGTVEVIGGKEKSLLELDLNMPAPCDDTPADTPAAFPFAVKDRSAAAILFPAPAPASALVDCHY
ncbi:zinc finger protein ZAT5-like [Lolium rigidum]|uniref:zinc finger protein ZAT5-like n=1 Tax=Lolium rigidum TaxID=89674 RepID=UPI001F5CAA68|nr:zinc finger protein ZAT5-like [Lolium rigidum]